MKNTIITLILLFLFHNVSSENISIDSLRSGDILLFHSSHTRARYIQKLQSIRDKTESSQYNHSGLLYKGRNDWYVVELGLKSSSLYETFNASLILTPLEECINNQNHIKILILRPKVLISDEKFESLLVKYIGTKYDYSNLILHQPIFKLTGIWLGKNKNSKRKMICNELITTIWNDLRGYFSDYNIGDMKDIYHSEYFVKLGYLKN